MILYKKLYAPKKCVKTILKAKKIDSSRLFRSYIYLHVYMDLWIITTQAENGLFTNSLFVLTMVHRSHNITHHSLHWEGKKKKEKKRINQVT